MTALSRFLASLGIGRSTPAAPPVSQPPGVPVMTVGEGASAPSLPTHDAIMPTHNAMTPIVGSWDLTMALPAMLRAVEFGDVDAWAKVLAGPMREAGITTPKRMAAFLANVSHETGGGRVLAENLSYSADRLRAVWPTRFPTAASAEAVARKPEAIANAVYGKRMGNTAPGDGWRYRGRGLIQITGRSNYTALGYADDPAWLETREGAAVSACKYWSINGLNATADTGDIEAVRRRVNGGLIGIDDVRRRYKAALAAG